MEMQTWGPMRKGDLRRRGDNFGYSSRINISDRRYYDEELLNYRQPKRPDQNWEKNRERREISLVGRAEREEIIMGGTSGRTE